MRSTDRPTAQELLDRHPDVLAQGQADNLHYDDGKTRFWLSRCGIADGMPYENTVMVETVDNNGRWTDFTTYDGGPLAD